MVMIFIDKKKSFNFYFIDEVIDVFGISNF